MTEAPSEPTVERTSNPRSPIHNPFPASLSSECKKASEIIDSFVNPSYNGLEGGIPRKILGPAKGLVICSVFKLGFLGSTRFGSGLIVCRLPNGGWSAPSAISLGGLGAGGQFGMEFTNFIFVLNTDAAVRTFMESGTLTLGGNISIAFGTGRSGETGAMIGTKGLSNIYAYSKTRGVFGGLTLEGGVLFERPSANKKIYGRKLKAKELLSEEIPPPPEAEPLMQILNSEIFQMPSDEVLSPGEPSEGTQQAVPPTSPEDLPGQETAEEPSDEVLSPGEPSEGIQQAIPPTSPEDLPGQETAEETNTQRQDIPENNGSSAGV